MIMENLLYDLLGEAPIQINATARKHPEMPNGSTGITELRFYLT